MTLLDPAPIKWDHLIRLTDAVGLIQHAFSALPNRASGYTVDDNARALLVALRWYEREGDRRAVELAERYMSFLRLAQQPDGRVRNILTYHLVFEDDESEDALGRAVLACGYACGWSGVPHVAWNARQFVERALPWMERLVWPRAQAFALEGLLAAGGAAQGDGGVFRKLARQLADNLVDRYQARSGPGWRWFEDELTYSNASLPRALLIAYRYTGRDVYLKVGRDSLDFLLDVYFRPGYLKLVG
ncbi:MAG: glycosyltransferase, partial [Clostridia bacterium]|nr:glycosyltransferase [Clostridia bacterium]